MEPAPKLRRVDAGPYKPGGLTFLTEMAEEVAAMPEERRAGAQKRVDRIKRMKFAILRNEARLIEIDSDVRCNLHLNKADYCSNCQRGLGRCIQLLDELIQLPVTPLMLKKNPEVVDAMGKVRRYFVKLDGQTMTEKEKEEIKKQAEIVRQKGDAVYCKFKGMFVVPDGKQFEEVFASQLEGFKALTEGMPEMVFLALTDELRQPWLPTLQEQ